MLLFFHHRNLSSAKQHNRQTMRKSQGLVDSMVKYVQDCVETGNPDDKVKKKPILIFYVKFVLNRLTLVFFQHSSCLCTYVTVIYRKYILGRVEEKGCGFHMTHTVGRKSSNKGAHRTVKLPD